MNTAMKKGAFLLFFLFNVVLVFPEETTTLFGEKFALNAMSNYNIGIFSQDQTLSYRTDEPFRIGLGFRYKKIAAQLYVPLSHNINSFDLEFNSYFEKMYIELFLKHYRSFYEDNEYTDVSMDVTATEMAASDVGLDVMAAGITVGRIYNYQNHSLSSVYHLDRKQNRASGSFLYGFGAFYTSIYSDSGNIKQYAERKHITHFGPMAGYSYTWILPHDMFINTSITVGADLGISAKGKELLFIPQIKPKISFGHHNRAWSMNVAVACNSTILLWDRNKPDILAPSTMMITFSKRF
jgi:hypothetical protein